jgi:hypothetical protein
VKNVPHLGSVVNTWSFLVPGLRVPPVRWMMALHTELAFLLWTLVHVAAMARWLLRDQPSPAAWVAFFLFPGVFVYDGNLGGSADHFLAFFIAPLFVAGMRAAGTLSPRAWALAGTLAGGALLTKLHAVYVLAPLSVLMAGGALAGVRPFRREPGAPVSLRALLAGPAAALACAVAVTAPHFVKNWVFYRNPFYPLAQGLFKHSTPGIPDAALQMSYLFADWRAHPPTQLGERLRSAAELVFTFSFRPHYSFLNNLPVYGSLLTLSLPLVLLVRERRRLWAGIFVSLGALFTWAFTFWVDRNLQTMTPILAATTAALLVRAWQLGRLARIGVAALVLAQIAWGVPLMFTGSDRMMGAINLIKTNFDRNGAGRYDHYRQAYVSLGDALPKDALVVLHNAHVSLGLDRRVLLDWIGFQGLIDYRTFHTARDLYRRFSALGVTHIVAQPGNRPAATKQEEVIFAVFWALHGGPTRSFGGLQLMDLPSQPPPDEAPYQVLALGVGGYADGVYGVDDLATIEEMPASLQHRPAPRTPVAAASADGTALGKVKVVLLGSDKTLGAAGNEILLREFRRVVSYGGFSVYVRTS